MYILELSRHTECLGETQNTEWGHKSVSGDKRGMRRRRGGGGEGGGGGGGT